MRLSFCVCVSIWIDEKHYVHRKGRDLMPIFYAIMNWGFKYEADKEKLGQE